MAHTKRLLLLLLIAASGAASSQSPPPPPPRPASSPPPPVTFGVEVNYVEVDAIVTDKAGNPVRDLGVADFEIREDGKPQKVELAALVDIPLPPRERPARPAPEPDVRSNAAPFEGRLYVLVLDDLHTAALRSQGVKQAARRFVEQHMGEQDLAAVVFTSGRSDAAQELTASRRLLLGAVDRFIGRRLRSSTLNRIDEYNLRREELEANERIRDHDQFERGYNARVALDTLKGVADWLGGIRGRRKALLYVSEGIDYDVHDPINNHDTGAILNSMRDLVRAATRSNVSVYSIDPRGLHSMGDEMMELSPVQDTSLGLDVRGLQSELRLAQDSLRVLADETVGRAAVATNDFAGAFERIVQDNSSYYVLGYRPADPRPDRFRKLEVRVRREGLEVRSRRGYVVRRAQKPEAVQWEGGRAPLALRELMARPLQQSGLPLAVHAAPFRGKDGKAAVMVTVQMDGNAFRFAEKGGQFQDTLDLSLGAVDKAGKFIGTDSQVKLDVKPQTREAMRAAGFRTVVQLDLPPGRYQLRVAARVANSEALGSVHYDLEVPDFAKEPLAISGVAVASAAASRVPTAGVFEPLKGVLPAQPTTFRGFFANDTLAVVAEVYDNELKTPHTLDIETSVRGDDGAVRFRSAEERKSEQLAALGGGSFVHRSQVPLKDLEPGAYTLRVEARSRIAKTPPVAREIAFRVLAAS